MEEGKAAAATVHWQKGPKGEGGYEEQAPGELGT